MKTYVKFLSLTLLTLIPTLTHAEIESEDAVHAAAHVGVSYAISNGAGSICKALNGSRCTCTLVAISAAMAAGVAKEVIDAKQGGLDKKNAIKGLTEDTIGTAIGVTFLNIAW